MKHHGIGVGYSFPHDFEGDDVEQQYLPDELVGRRYYVPNDQGHEATIAARMAARDDARREKPRRKERPDPPMASMGDGVKGSMESRKKLAETQNRDAGDVAQAAPDIGIAGFATLRGGTGRAGTGAGSLVGAAAARGARFERRRLAEPARPFFAGGGSGRA